MKKKIIVVLFVTLIILSFNSVSAAPKSPNIVISKYNVEQKEITPGSTFKVELNLKNYGEYHARKVKISLNNEQGQEDLGSFSPLNQSNVQYISLVEASKTKKISYNMYVSPKIEPGNYNIIVNISYNDYNGTQYDEIQTIGLLVRESESIQLLADDNLGDIIIGKPLETEVQIVNNGVSDVKGISAAVVGEGTNAQIEYLGNFSSGDYDNYGFTIIGEEPGEKSIKVSVKYKNSLNEESTVEKDITYNVIANGDSSNSQDKDSSGNWFTNFIKGIFGLS
ncbi:hypothetical protein GC105_03590 [Alkalibaculum sp. M08DMB]|uniref:CARDB domain-containing protein n=1 Tax=Alkalibaculum sporogenes TaxID=2655001 RepID=A0A6A7K658_9FIRM|nr:hypothetical protein [Alkalibaculum sporogenes]MPW24872.1 hypothetical protein [Alkalibaculum sporogenes]